MIEKDYLMKRKRDVKRRRFGSHSVEEVRFGAYILDAIGKYGINELCKVLNERKCNMLTRINRQFRMSRDSTIRSVN